jgi:hypothetical protein
LPTIGRSGSCLTISAKWASRVNLPRLGPLPSPSRLIVPNLTVPLSPSGRRYTQRAQRPHPPSIVLPARSPDASYRNESEPLKTTGLCRLVQSTGHAARWRSSMPQVRSSGRARLATVPRVRREVERKRRRRNQDVLHRRLLIQFRRRRPVSGRDSTGGPIQDTRPHRAGRHGRGLPGL